MTLTEKHGLPALCASITPAPAGGFAFAGIGNHPYHDESQSRKNGNTNRNTSGIIP
jgi:hypothetical protein